uniref:Putative long-chain-fatty-acid--CoA ligase n=1 Tax=Paulinella micropora TaxID=1928728 RepID=A0A385I124_9EUKA|nr:putative long-chain-fatty-acid--CoA ligase [Paulinella micropora]AXY63629.1 putative long-chain-fatty-acid--CoA ligase [Paulinella micropora]
MSIHLLIEIVVKQALISWHGGTEDHQYLTDETHWKNLSNLDQLWPQLSQFYTQSLALVAPHTKVAEKFNYHELDQQIHQSSAVFAQLGLESRDIVALFAENSPRWLITDQGLMRVGAADAVRSISAPTQELVFIINDSGSVALVVESASILKNLDLKISLLFILVLEGEAPEYAIRWESFVARGLISKCLPPLPSDPLRLATLVYTSGTTSKPKGVPLTHSNLIHQIFYLGTIVRPRKADQTISILPIWHAYERSIEYFLLSRGCCQNYTTLRQLRKDLQSIQPAYLPSVPRLWQAFMEGFEDTLKKQYFSQRSLLKACLKLSRYHRNRNRLASNLSTEPIVVGNRIVARIESVLSWLPHTFSSHAIWPTVRQRLVGGFLRTAICGGGTLSHYVDSFFDAIGIELLVGYGLTETSPVLTCCREWANRHESVGYPLPATDIKIIDTKTKKPLSWGEKGKVLARGPQVMKGYFRYGQETNSLIDNDGWFDTGDLGQILSDGSLILTGRFKEVIVLNNGENVDPVPLEACLSASELVEQVLVIGQDQRCLAALVVLKEEAINGSNVLTEVNTSSQLTLLKSIKETLNRILAERAGSRYDERLGGIILVDPFTIENGLLTQTLKQRRDKILARNQKAIDKLYAS